LVRADRVRAAIRRAFAAAFGHCDIVTWPASPAPAPLIENPTVELPSGTSLADPPNLRQACPANLAGVPGISVPAGLADGMPAASSCSPPGARIHACSTPPSTSNAPRTARSSTR
jgi:aspartyl-tRNA(Asn)/glutamyl-tRNA(Gln) amidotransferase subunit A